MLSANAMPSRSARTHCIRHRLEHQDFVAGRRQIAEPDTVVEVG